MAFNIANFKSTVNHYGGFQKTNKYKVQFLPPPIMMPQMAVFRDLEYFAEQALLPGVNFETHDVRRYGYGPMEKRPTGHVFNDFVVVFTGDGYSKVHKAMYEWLSAISPFDMSLGITTDRPYLVAYKDTYVTDLHVKTFNEKGFEQNTLDTEYEPNLDIVLREAFPIAISDVGLGWSDHNNYVKFTVHFAYTDWFRITA